MKRANAIASAILLAATCVFAQQQNTTVQQTTIQQTTVQQTTIQQTTVQQTTIKQDSISEIDKTTAEQPAKKVRNATAGIGIRGDGSFEGWLRRYVRGYVLNSDPNPRGDVSIEGAHPDADDGCTVMEIPADDKMARLRNEVWGMTHWCLRKMWNEDPERCYIHVLKTRFFLSSEEIRDLLDMSSAANVDQIFSRSVRFMRETAFTVWK